MISQTEYECSATEERLECLRRLRTIVFAVGVTCLVVGLALLVVAATGVML